MVTNMKLCTFILAALWITPSWASTGKLLPGPSSLGPDDQVVEGIITLQPPGAGKEMFLTVERRQFQTTDGAFFISTPASPAFLIVDRTIKGDAAGPLRSVEEERRPDDPASSWNGRRVRVFVQLGRALICPVDSEGPRKPACERRNEQLGVWQSIQGRIDTAKAEGDADALLHLADGIAKTDPSSAVRALLVAMNLGSLRGAGSRASEMLVAQARYPEAVTVLDRVIAAQGTAASPDLLARRELARAMSGLPFDASKVDLSHSTLSDIRFGPVVLHDHTFDGVVWRNAHLDGVDLSGLQTHGFEVDRGSMDHVSFRGAKATVAVPLSEQAASGRRALVVPPDWDGKSAAPTLEDIVRNASGTAVTAFSLQLTRSPFKLHASINDSDFTDASLPFAEINGSRGSFYSRNEAATQRTTFDRGDLEAAGFGGHLEQVSFKDAKLDWAEFTQATLDHVSFDGTSLAGAEFSVVQFRGVDFSHAKLWKSDPTVEGVLHRLDKRLILDPVLGLRFNPATFGRSTYDCETKWPHSFEPTQYGLVPTRSSCVDRKAIDFDDVTIPSLTISKGTDLSGASFRGAHVTAFCQEGSLHGANFTGAVLSGTTSGCDLADALFNHATVTANLSGATLIGAKFIDSTIDIEAIASFSFGGFSISRPPDPSQRRFTDLPGAIFERSHLSCASPEGDPSGRAFRDGNEERTVAALRKLQGRGLELEESCRQAFPNL